MQTERLKSLDAFRGFTIAAMILVNYPGSWTYIYSPLQHAEWNGLTPTDLIFPFFLFIVGISICLAYSKKLSAGIPKRSMHSKILIRSFKIFAVGLILNYIQDFDLSELRIAGVLQRISIVFLICSFLYLHTKKQTQIYVLTTILILYWVAMCFIPTPKTGIVTLEPGLNMAAWVDSYLLPGKMWQGNWDPEGVFSTFPAIATCILGMLGGELILSSKTKELKIIWLFIIGFCLCIVGYLWSLHFPINKNIWTSSFVLVTGGLAFLFLASGIFIVDLLKRDRLAQIGIVFGSNAISAYVLAALLSFIFYTIPFTELSLNQHFMIFFTPHAPKLGSVLYALLYLSINYIPIYFLYKKKIFIKL